MAPIAHRVWVVFGRVQGVGYRAHVARVAQRYPLVGNVRNLTDGTVRIEAQGASDVLGQFLEEILLPSWPIHPKGVRQSEELPEDPSLQGFHVVHGVP